MSEEPLMRSCAAAELDARRVVREFDNACQWLDRAKEALVSPLGAEVWVFDEDLAQVLLVNHPWRAWVPPGGKVEPGETPREAASRELFEETGLRAELLSTPAAVAVRSYSRGWSPTLGLSYVAIVDVSTPLVEESGQPLAWTRLDHDWDSFFPDDPRRIRWHAGQLAHGRIPRR